MVIISGKAYVAPERRAEYLASFQEFMAHTRNEPGCLDFFIVADPIEEGRLNIFELWESNEIVEAYQKRADSPEPGIEILSEDVLMYEISKSGPVFP